jgi:transcriptional regulator with XRE-family HTH domain
MLDNFLSLSRPEDFVATTTADLRAARMLLGLSRVEMGQLLGVDAKEVQLLERGRTHFVFRGHAAMLEAMLEQVNTLLLEHTGDAVPAPEFLFCYPNNEVFEEMEPALSKWMRFNSVHQMFMTRVMDDWMQRDHRPVIVEIVPKQYQEFIAVRGGKDTIGQRTAWAMEHLKVIKYRPGLPRQDYEGKIKFEATDDQGGERE